MFAAAFSVIMILFLLALSRGPGAYRSFLRWLDTPWSIALSAIILGAVLYHTGTWFKLTTHIVSIRFGRWTASREAVAAGLALAWIAASAFVAYFHIWF
jgi:fumarate reductase subunit C